MNGGFGMVLDGSQEMDRRLQMMLYWDVNNGIARRSWARNDGAVFTIKNEMKKNPGLLVTIPNIPDDDIINKLF
jgi:urocanate hydratase